MAVNKICDELLHEKWLFYTNASVIPHVEGIYVIGVKKPRKRAITYLYLGQSTDVHERIKQHRYGDQEIDRFIKRNYRKNGGKDLRVKWVHDPKHKEAEEDYIKCLEHKLHYELKYNKRGGDN